MNPNQSRVLFTVLHSLLFGLWVLAVYASYPWIPELFFVLYCICLIYCVLLFRKNKRLAIIGLCINALYLFVALTVTHHSAFPYWLLR
jgi:hypothetical protein